MTYTHLTMDELVMIESYHHQSIPVLKKSKLLNRSRQTIYDVINSLLRKDGLPKEMDFNTVDQIFVSSIVHKRNKIPRKSLNYQTPLEILSMYVNESDMSSLY